MRFLPVLALVVLASGCSGSDDSPFSPDDLPDLVLRPSEVPPPMVFDPSRSGYITPKLSEGEGPFDEPLPFEPGTNAYVYRALYTQPEMLEMESIPDGTSQFMLHTHWFESERLAAGRFRQLLGPHRPPGFRGKRLPVESLGSEAGRYETLPDEEFPYRGDWLVWRTGNVVTTLLSSALPLAQVLSIARSLYERVVRQR